MANLFGASFTNVGKIVSLCEEELDKDKVQIITGKDLPANRRCYIVVGLESLSKSKVDLFNRCRGTLVVMDCLPALHCVENIKLLDASSEDIEWKSEAKLNTKALFKSLQAKPSLLHVNILPDTSMKTLIKDIRSRGILDIVLSAAKSMRPADRATLHSNVARVLVGQLNVNTLRRRSSVKAANTEAYELMIDSLTSATAIRLSHALKAVIAGEDIKQAAIKNQVDAFELRFILSHLKKESKDT